MLTMRCEECTHEYEYLHRKISEEPAPICEKCGSPKCVQVFAEMPGVNLVKGKGGFYSRDYEDPRKKIEYLGSDPYGNKSDD